MRHVLPQAIAGTRFETKIFESVQGIILKVMFPMTAENLHNLYAGQNCFVSVTLRDNNSKDLNIINNVPMLRLLQLSAWRKGYFEFGNVTMSSAWQGQPAGEYIGLIGVIRFSDRGAIRLRAGMHLLIEITDIPNTGSISMNTLENPQFADEVIITQKKLVNSEEPNHLVNLDDQFDTILLPISPQIERKYSHPQNSYTNPLDYVRLRDVDKNAPDSKMTWAEIRAYNINESGNDTVAIWGHNPLHDYPRLNQQAYIPDFMFTGLTADSKDKYRLANKTEWHGYFDWGIIDLENIDTMEIIRLGNTTDEIPYFLERTEPI